MSVKSVVSGEMVVDSTGNDDEINVGNNSSNTADVNQVVFDFSEFDRIAGAADEIALGPFAVDQEYSVQMQGGKIEFNNKIRKRIAGMARDVYERLLQRNPILQGGIVVRIEINPAGGKPKDVYILNYGLNPLYPVEVGELLIERLLGKLRQTKFAPLLHEDFDGLSSIHASIPCIFKPN
ncbi:MAG: hypothetical protein HN337_00765 [Deltaproteobacteria bacterium]|jgi:hypothetical protein|nr:hypothetical protein [Deltaproteobacteria bacterium]